MKLGVRRGMLRAGAAVVVMAAGLGLPAAAVGQGYGNAPGQQGMPVEGNRIVQRVNPHDWTLTVTVNVRADTDFDGNGMPRRESFDFTSAAIVFPLIKETAGSVLHEPTGVLSVDTRKVTSDVTMLEADYPGGTRLGKWQLVDLKAGQMVNLEVTLPVTSWETRFDEAEAMKLGWPDAWPEPAQSTFKPQMFLDYLPGYLTRDHADNKDVTPVKDLLAKWMEGKEPKSLPPVTLAKFLCGKVAQHVQISGAGLNAAQTGELEGVNLQGAAETARLGRGSRFDQVCLLAAVYRMAGLPARTVIGWDAGGDKERKSYGGRRGGGGLKSWVEFALADPQTPGGLVWVPVDVNELDRRPSSIQDLRKPWPYFGTSEEMSGVIPFAFQFHPPTTVTAYGSPAFWGWLVTPEPPKRVVQVLRFRAITTPKTAESVKQKQQEKEKKRKNPYGK